MTDSVQLTHPTLINSELTTCERIRACLERFTCGGEVLNKTMITLISAAAALALLGLALTLTGTAPDIASYSFVMGGAIFAGAILGTFLGIYNARSQIHAQMERDQLTEAHVAIVTHSYYWLKAALNDSSIDPNATTKSGETALHLAVVAEDATAVALILDNPRARESVNMRTAAPRSGAPSSSTEISDLLGGMRDAVRTAEHAARQMQVSLAGGDAANSGATPLQLAAKIANETILRLLLRNGANPNDKDVNRDDVVGLTNRVLSLDTEKRDKVLAILREFGAPASLTLLDKAVPKQQAEEALKASGYTVSADLIQPLGKAGDGGYHAIVGSTRYLYQGAVRDANGIQGQFVNTHVHEKDEQSYVAFGGAHVWTWPKDSGEQYRFYRQGDTMLIPAGTPHCVVAASHRGKDGQEQLGVLMVRSSEANPQQFPPDLPKPKVMTDAIARLPAT